ncbi:MAG TPA: BMP family ABC transporter substrate-binding protein [Gaiellaceae bacterium]|nr:BMP family ABC transporter substrate-binding protein [Gaiellaceae bacterium]
MRVSRWLLAAGAVALIAALAVGTAFGSSKAPNAPKAGYKAALVSDVAGFNDNGFNKNQLKGLKQAAKKLGGTAFPIVSHSSSDYQPNYNTAIHDGAQIIIAAGFLLGPTVKQYATQYPNTKFAITDDPVSDIGGFKNEEGITYATQEGGCLVGVLAAKMAQKMGHKVIGVAGGLKIPPVDSYIAGYKYCARKAVKGTKVVVQYSGDFVDQSKCAAIAQNEIQGQKAQVVFQVAGLCGDGALKEASKLHKWGIGVDADEYSVASRILTSALKKTDVGVYDTIVGAANGKFKGGKDLVFNLKNNGVGVGKTSPKVPKSWIKLMNSYKTKIIKGKLKPPAVLK